jgi:phage tail tape-measure protein
LISTLSDLEAAGAADVIHPADVAQSVSASVMRHLLPRHALRQIGAADMPKVLRDALERELTTVLRSVQRRRTQAQRALPPR